MKKSLFIGALLTAGVALTSCNHDSDSPHSTMGYVIPTYNLFTETSGSSAPFVSVSKYTYVMEFPANTVQVKGESVIGPGGASFNFNTEAMPFTQSYVTMDNKQNAEVVTFGPAVTTSNPAVTYLKCTLSQAAVAPADVEIPGYEKRFMPSDLLHFTLMQYKYNTWNVRTFWPDMTFAGTTSTSGAGVSEDFRSENTSYRVIMKRNEDNTIQNKADLIIYNAAFAQGMPTINIVVKDLALEFNAMGYVISGENIIPYMVEAGELQAAPRFVFNKINLAVTGDLTVMQAKFTVAGVFQGNFTGSCFKN